MTSWYELVSLIAPVQPKLLRVLYSNEMIPNAPKHYVTHQNMRLVSNGVDQVCSLQIFPTRLRCPNFCNNCTKVRLFCINFCAIMKRSQMQPNTIKRTKAWVYGPMFWPGAFIAKYSIAISWYKFCTNCTSSASLYHISCGNESFQYAPKHYETHQNMSLGSNGVDQVRSLRKIPTWLRGTNFFH